MTAGAAPDQSSNVVTYRKQQLSVEIETNNDEWPHAHSRDDRKYQK
jgi:hypothetical protein